MQKQDKNINLKKSEAERKWLEAEEHWLFTAPLKYYCFQE